MRQTHCMSQSSAGSVYLSDLPGVVSHTYCSRKKVWLEREQYVHGWYKKLMMQYLKQQQPASLQRKGVVQPATLYFPATFTTKEMGTSDCILVKLPGLSATARWRQGAGWLGRIVTKKGKTSLNADHVCHHHVHHLSSLHQQGDSVTLSLYSVVSHLICIKVATFTSSKDTWDMFLGFVCRTKAGQPKFCQHVINHYLVVNLI